MPYTTTFKKLQRSAKKTYLGKSVPSKYRREYGKRYDKDEIKNISFAIAKSRGIKIHKYGKK